MDLAQRLIKLHEEGKKIIIGVDFDDTLLYQTNATNQILIELLKEVYPYSTLCLYTVADAQLLRYKAYIMELWGIKPHFVNASIIDKWEGCIKPYFNILLDDKAGLTEATTKLKEFNNYLKEKNNESISSN